MMRYRKGRAKRLKDFWSQIQYHEMDPPSTYTDLDIEYVRSVPEEGWSYIPVQPMADETELLARLGMSREQCTCIDSYWRDDRLLDVAFLEVYARDGGIQRSPGLYGRCDTNVGGMLYLVAVTTLDVIDRAAVENAMRAFAAVGLERLFRNAPRLGRNLLPLSAHSRP